MTEYTIMKKYIKIIEGEKNRMDSENCRETKLERIKRRYEEGKLRRIKMVRGEGYERI